MFTGIIEEIGKVRARQQNANGLRLEVECVRVIEDVGIGDSISINGICLTVVSFTGTSFSVEMVSESLKKSAADAAFKVGANVNLERALAAGGRLHGHIVQGHVDDVAIITGISERNPGKYFTLSFPEKWKHHLVEEGSIAIDGLSLTVADKKSDHFSVAIIPHTLEHSIFKYYSLQQRVNLEFDVLGKYVLNLVDSKTGHEDTVSDILQRNAY